MKFCSSITYKERLLEMGFHRPAPVQVESSILYDGKTSAIIESETGSGKTLAYLLPLLSQIDPAKRLTYGIVIVPTRELGLQVKSVASQLVCGMLFTSLHVYLLFLLCLHCQCTIENPSSMTFDP